MFIRLVLLLSLAATASCAAKAPLAPHEILDEQSAGTLTVVAAPLVFARDRSDVAAHSRDYATLVAIEVDRSGNYSEFLLLYRWSTVDRRMSSAPGAEGGELRILADGRSIDLKPLAQVPIGLQKGRELHLPKHGDAAVFAYAVDPALLRFLAASRELSVRMPQEPLDTPFALYEDGRRALGEFLSRTVTP